MEDDLTKYTETELTLLYISRHRDMEHDIASNINPKLSTMLRHIQTNVHDFRYRMNRVKKATGYYARCKDGNFVRRPTRGLAVALARETKKYGEKQ